MLEKQKTKLEIEIQMKWIEFQRYLKYELGLEFAENGILTMAKRVDNQRLSARKEEW